MSDNWLESFRTTFNPSCPVCRKPLTLAGARCQRCGSELKIGLKVLEVYLAGWGTALAGAGMMAGFGLFLLFLKVRRPYFRSDLETVVIVANCIAGVVMAIATITLLLLRRRFCRLPRFLQWTAAFAFCSVALGGTIAFFAVIH